MALESGKRMALAKSDSHTGSALAAIENRLMTKVLLIEDDSETAEEITAELADRGFEVEWSANGIEGLDKARSLRPDAMIVDRLLPGMDGLTVIEALRKDQVRTPVLVLSALGAVDDRVRGLRRAVTIILQSRSRLWSSLQESRPCCADRLNRARRRCGQGRWSLT